MGGVAGRSKVSTSLHGPNPRSISENLSALCRCCTRQASFRQQMVPWVLNTVQKKCDAYTGSNNLRAIGIRSPFWLTLKPGLRKHPKMSEQRGEQQKNSTSALLECTDDPRSGVALLELQHLFHKVRERDLMSLVSDSDS